MKQAKSKIFSRTLLSIAIIFSSLELHAYSFTQDFNKGLYWPSFPIKVDKFVSEGEDAALLEQLTNEAVSEWESAVGKDIWEFTPVQALSSNSRNFIRWSQDIGAETGYDPSRTLAVTIRFNRGTFFERTVILLNASMGYLKQNWGNSLKITILHEIGHTLGLDHSATNAVMAPNLSGVSSLQADDIEGINAVVDETIRRQTTGFIAPFLASEENKNALIPTCATVEEVTRSGQGPKGGAGQFVFSVFIGLMMALVFSRRPRATVLIKY